MKKKPKAYTVYGHCNLTNGKWYVGMTSQEPKKRWESGWGYKFNQQMWNDIEQTKCSRELRGQTESFGFKSVQQEYLYYVRVERNTFKC